MTSVLNSQMEGGPFDRLFVDPGSCTVLVLNVHPLLLRVLSRKPMWTMEHNRHGGSLATPFGYGLILLSLVIRPVGNHLVTVNR